MTKKNLIIKLVIGSLLAPLAWWATDSQAGDIGVSFHLGLPFPAAIIAPQPVYRRNLPAFSFRETPEFIYSPSLNFYVGVNSPYDLFYYNNSYFIFDQGYWHRSPQLDGPWQIVDYHILPPGFRRHKIEQMRRYRDADFKASRRQHGDRRDRRYAPARDYREERHYRDERRSGDRERRNYRDDRRPRDFDRDHR